MIGKVVGAVLILLFVAWGIWWCIDPYAVFELDTFLVKYLHYDLYHNIMSVYDEATLITLNKSLQQYVGHLIFGGRVPSSDYEKILTVRDWLNKHFRYIDRDEDQWVPPDQVLRQGGGICSDMAAVAATALVYANVSEVYMLCSMIHCVCAIPINDTLYNVDNTKPRPLHEYFNCDHVEGVVIINKTVVKRVIIDLESLRKKE